ncbi:MAG: S-adenosylmethionine:tRNA ribosyltransferase-isomerase [Acidimicrobiales bacterium]
MTTTTTALAFDLSPELIATEPIETLGLRRDAARMLVSWRSRDAVVDASFADLGHFLEPGDVLVVNDSATLPAAVATGDGRLVHLSTELGDGLWVVELRHACGAGSTPLLDGPTQTVSLPEGARVELLAPYPAGHEGPVRLWLARLGLPAPLTSYLARHGQPIRYGCGDEAWPLSAYQTVFGLKPGSAEMPSAARGFTPELVARLVAAGVVLAPITLHTGVSSLEASEPPYPERYVVPQPSADIVNEARAVGRRVIAVGTTATRAIETTADERGWSHSGRGWTDLVITPERGVRAVDGIISGWHEAEASHLLLLEAVAGSAVLVRSYAQALSQGYRWHQFGDFHLVLP